MNIGIDAHMLGHHETGNETYIFELVQALTELDQTDQFFIYVEQPAALPDEVTRRANVHIRELETRSPAPRLLSELPRRAGQDRLDLLHVTYNAPLRLHRSCALVVTVHDISFTRFPQFFSRRDRLVLGTLVPRSVRAAKQVITDSDSAKRDLLAEYRLPADKVTVTYYAAGPQFRSIADPMQLENVRAKYNTSERFILTVGNLQPRKNIERLVAAFAQAKQEYHLPHRLVIVGQTQWRGSAVAAAVQAQGLASEVLLTGYVPDEDLIGLYSAAEIFVYPSLYEGFGLPVLEAMACGAPVIASNIGPLPEITGGAARLVDPYQVDDIACALGELGNNAVLRAQRREAGLARATKFSWTRTAEQTLEVYKRAVNSNVS